MESTTTHVLHSVIIVGILYVVMRFALKQSHTMSLTRSVLIGAIALVYMILFGHGLPTRMNSI